MSAMTFHPLTDQYDHTVRNGKSPPNAPTVEAKK
jgi:hypothetical protein